VSHLNTHGKEATGTDELAWTGRHEQGHGGTEWDQKANFQSY
jgi:hypothetical protein